MPGVTNRKNFYANSINLIIFITSVIYLSLSFVPANTSFAQDGTSNTQADLAWAEFDGGDLEIYYAYFGDNSWGPKIKLSNNDSVDFRPSITSGSDGIVWVVWSMIDGLETHLFYSYFDGVSWTPSAKILTHLASNLSPSVFVDRNNTPWIVWAGFDGQDDEIYFARWNGDGWELPMRVNRDDSMPDVLPNIGINPEGRPYVIWSGYDGESYRQYISKWTGTEWEDEAEVENTGAYPSMIKNKAHLIPDLPAYIGKQSQASVHIRGIQKVQSIRLHDIRNLSLVNKTANVDLEPMQQLAKTEVVIIAFGDSITQGYPDIGEPGDGRRIGGYEPKLEKFLKGPSQTPKVLNYGIGGENTTSGLKRIRSIIKSNNVDAKNAKLFLLMEGTNDRFSFSRSTTYTNLRAMIDRIRGNKVTPIIATLTPDTRPGFDVFKAINTTYNVEIKKIAAQKNVKLAEQYSPLIKKWEKLSVDLLHPNDAGHRIIAKTWFNAFSAATVLTWGAIALDDTSATVSGFINPNHFPARYHFEYGLDTNYGISTPVMNAGSGNKVLSVSAELSGIDDNTLYHVRLVVTNDYGTFKGKDKSFETLKTPDKKACFIATAAFGSPLEPGVIVLKAFRDKFLLNFGWGRAFVDFYYRNSPKIADVVARNKSVKIIVKAGLYPLIGFSYVMLNSSAGVKIIFFSLFVFLFIGLGISIFYYRIKN